MPSYKNFGLTPSFEEAITFDQDGTTPFYNTAASSSAGEYSYTYNFQSFYKELTQDVDNELFIFDARKVNIVEILFYLSKPNTGNVLQSNYLAKYVATIGINEDFEGVVEDEESIFYIEQEGDVGGLAPNIGLIGDPPHGISYTEASPSIFNVKFTINPIFASTIRGIYQYI